jgi:hypothetical protein
MGPLAEESSIQFQGGRERGEKGCEETKGSCQEEGHPAQAGSPQGNPEGHARWPGESRTEEARSPEARGSQAQAEGRGDAGSLTPTLDTRRRELVPDTIDCRSCAL